MFEPAYKNQFDKPVYNVNHLHMKKRNRQAGDPAYLGSGYELQLNDQYFLITEQQLQVIEAIVKLPDNISISMG